MKNLISTLIFAGSFGLFGSENTFGQNKSKYIEISPEKEMEIVEVAGRVIDEKFNNDRFSIDFSGSMREYTIIDKNKIQYIGIILDDRNPFNKGDSVKVKLGSLRQIKGQIYHPDEFGYEIIQFCSYSSTYKK